MKNLKLVLMIVVLGSLAASALAEVVTIHELDQDGRKTVVEFDSGASIVDINSTLEFAIDKDALKAEIAGTKGFASETLALQIKTVGELQDKVLEGLKLLPEYQRVFLKREKGDDVDEDVRALNVKSTPILVALMGVFPKDGSGARERLIRALNKARAEDDSWVGYYRAMIEQATIEVEAMKEEVNSLAKKEGVYIQFGGWITTKKAQTPIHLDGFDNHPDANPYDVERWDFSLDVDEKKELERYTEIAAEYAAEEKSLADFINDQMKAAADSFKDGLNECLESIQQTFKDLEDTEQNKAVVASANALKTNLSFMATALTKEETQKVDKNLLIAFNEASLGLAKEVQTLIKALDEAAQAAEPAIKSSIETIVADCKVQMDKVLKSNSGGIGAIIAAAVSSRSMVEQNLEFGDEVIKHDLESLPSSTTLLLRNTGVREDGDFLSFRMVIGQKDKPVIPVQKFRIDMFKVLPFITTSPVLVFAQPSQSNVFKPAPAYSVVMSKGSRNSHLQNRLLRPGFGINMSLLDFDNDDNMELGAAVVATWFKEMLQIGGGINLAQNQSYWFLGLRLPMPSGSI